MFSVDPGTPTRLNMSDQDLASSRQGLLGAPKGGVCTEACVRVSGACVRVVCLVQNGACRGVLKDAVSQEIALTESRSLCWHGLTSRVVVPHCPLSTIQLPR